MLKLEQHVYEQILDLLTPQMDSESSRRGLITPALSAHRGLYERIDWSGAPRDFTTRLVDQCLKYSEVEPGKQALVLVLESVRKAVGVDEQSKVGDILVLLGTAATLPDVQPYRGLEPFEAEHAEFFFGRKAMVERLVAKVAETDFVAVVGSSGCGKSSLVRAGLLTALREGALPGSQDWEVRFFRPSSDPLGSLSIPLISLLEVEADEIERMDQIRRLADRLGGGTLTLADVAARLREKRPDLPRLVLVADQFEELYTECQDQALRQALIEALLSGRRERNLALVLTLRADFYGHVLNHRELGGAVDAGQLNVLPMSDAELRAAIEQPALRTGRSFEPGLVNRILEDVVEQPGNLPLLEFALKELWGRQTAGGALTHDAYEAIGAVSGAIARRAEAVYEELAAQGQGETVQHIFLRLTHYGEGVEGTRRRVAEDDLVTRSAPRGAVERVVVTLADARLLVTGREEETGKATVEVAHEALIRVWGRLGRWLDQDRAFGLWRERLAVVRRIWQETEHDEDALLHGALLSEAEGWLSGRGDDLAQAERDFIQASVALRKREAEAEAKAKREEEWLLWMTWVTVNVVGGTLGMAAGEILGLAVGGFLGEFVGGAVLGAVVGTMQWLVLRRQTLQADRWVLASTIGWAVGVIVVGAAADTVGAVGTMGGVASGAVLGTVIGTMQWLVLRRQVRQAGWWVLASTIGWAALSGVGTAVDLALGDGIADAVGVIFPWAVSGAVSGAGVGAITGIVLVSLMRHPMPKKYSSTENNTTEN